MTLPYSATSIHMRRTKDDYNNHHWSAPHIGQKCVGIRHISNYKNYDMKVDTLKMMINRNNTLNKVETHKKRHMFHLIDLRFFFTSLRNICVNHMQYMRGT